MASLFEQDFLTTGTEAAEVTPAPAKPQEAPSTPKASDILAKILGAKKTHTQRIAEADLAFCTRMDRNYKEVIAQLTKWEKIYRDELEANWKGQYVIDKHYSGNCYLSKEPRKYDTDKISRLTYFPGESLVIILNNLAAAKSTYAESITEYFNAEYNLSFSFPKERIETMTDYNDIIDYIFTVLPTPTLSDMGTHNRKEEFRKFIHYQNRIQVTSNRIDLTTYHSIINARDYMTDATRRYSFNHHSNDFKILFAGLALFETGDVTKDISSDCHINEVVDFSEKYAISGKKVTNIKFYKNNKITLYFNSSTEAQEFYTFYDFSTLEKSRW